MRPCRSAFEVAPTYIPVAGASEVFPVRRIYCIGRNYAAHAREMGSDPTREPPFFFQKPTDAIQYVAPGTVADHPYPSLTRNYHYEVELVCALKSGGMATLFLGRRLGPAGFARHEHIFCGVRGTTTLRTATVLDRCQRFSATHGGTAIASAMPADRMTKHWAICTGAGAGHSTIAEAVALGVDTLIVGEGPHWSAVDAPEKGLVIIYAGHYATETLGVRALADHVTATFGLPWSWISAPTGL